MQFELDAQIETEIEIFQDTSFKELEYIRTHDWTILKDRGIRISDYEFQKELTKNNLALASKFHTLAKNDLAHPAVKESLDKFNDFLLIALDRFERYKKENDWTTYSENGESGKQNSDIRSEIEFQNGIVKDIQSFKASWKKIDSGGQVGSLSIGVHADLSLPLMFENMAVAKHPEITEFLEKRKYIQETKKKE